MHTLSLLLCKYYVTSIHNKATEGTVCTTEGFDMKSRIERLKRELRII